MDDFLRDSEIEMGWSILLLQEFTASSFSERFRSSAGHQVFFVPPTEGNRSCAIVIHVSIVHRVLGHTFVHRDRGVAVGLHWEGWNLLVISSHLHPGHSTDLYSESLIQLQELMEVGNLRSKFVSSRLFAREILDTPVYRIIGIDAQASVVKYLSRDHQAIIGDAANGSVSWKCTEFVRLCLENNLKYGTLFQQMWMTSGPAIMTFVFQLARQTTFYLISPGELPTRRESSLVQRQSRSIERPTWLCVASGCSPRESIFGKRNLLLLAGPFGMPIFAT